QVKAVEHKHMMFAEAAKLAAKAEVGQMWLTHFSPALTRPKDYIEETRKIFPESYVGTDGKSVTLEFDKNE
ncbi:MAG: ribonuclease Z, partial [Lachnospiraceae bacterium]|nr:ribonuclease Z [Lachnospiraceae bacterium]